MVQLISLSRLLAALIFSSLAFQNVPTIFVAGVYVFAIGSDLIDGFLARRLEAETYFGKVLDLVSDKSLTIVSLLYAAACGVTVLPLAMIATRETVAIGARMIIVDDTQLFPTNRIVGGLLAVMLWGNTLFLLCARNHAVLFRLANTIYWACAFAFVSVLLERLYVSARRIKASLISGR